MTPPCSSSSCSWPGTRSAFSTTWTATVSSTTGGLKDAVVRCLEVIGEAGKQVSPETRGRLSEVPWSLMARTRDVLIHSYAKVDLVEVYRTVKRDLPPLVAALEPLDLEGEGSADSDRR